MPSTTAANTTASEQQNPLELLIDACRDGDEAQTRKLILQHKLDRQKTPGTSRAVLDSMGARSFDTPLIAACKRGHVGVVAALLELGVDVNATMMGETTPLYTAAKEGHTAIVEVLLAHSALVSSLYDEGGPHCISLRQRASGISRERCWTTART